MKILGQDYEFQYFNLQKQKRLSVYLVSSISSIAVMLYLGLPASLPVMRDVHVVGE